MAWSINPQGQMRRARMAFGEWLSLPEWQWFTTHTFKADYVSRKVADRHWQSWLNSLCLVTKPRPFYFRVVEYQDRGTLHYHSLIGNVGNNIPRLFFKDLWELFGFARVEKYDPKLGAAHYVGKYLTKADGDIRFSHNLRQHLTRACRCDTLEGNDEELR